MSWHKVLICGARDWQDTRFIRDVLARLQQEHGSKLIIIEGEASGADQAARAIAEDMSIHVARVHALWGTRHRGAGPQRNEAMLALDPDEVLAFHNGIKNSTGTKDMIQRVEKAGIPHKLYRTGDKP